MLGLNKTLSYYKRKDVQEAIVQNAANREVAIKYGDNFGKRPDIIKYPRDVLELAKQGATSFHASEELWKNPLQLGPDMGKRDLDDLRVGWDLVIDIDCDNWEYSKIAADLIIKALKHYNINNISAKFSGNKGFHIGIPFESFPERVVSRETKLLFPDAPRRIALYLKSMIEKHLKERTGNAKPFSVLSIDTILISSRHLYRMPYSFNEKSGLVSVPIEPDEILKFEKDMAKPENVEVKYRFLEKNNMNKGEAKQLIVQAFDSDFKEEEIERLMEQDFAAVQKAIPEKFFPPCIQNILKGISDGKKRSLFILVNFLVCVGWDYAEIEKLLKKWNEKNAEPLKDVLILGQVRYHKQQKKKILPPNCNNQMYYVDFRVCTPDNLCSKIKNPVNYSVRKTRYLR